MIYRKYTLFDQGLCCVILLVLGISNTSIIPTALRHTLDPFLLPLLLFVLLADQYHRAKHSKKDIQREQRDERSQMILEKSIWYCHQTESGVLLGLYGVFALFLHKYEIAAVLLWVLIGRNLFALAIRWWLSRKY